jgi:hypothetical protein
VTDSHILPVWSCSGWGLPSRTGHPVRWWALTPPFHPYRFRPEGQKVGGLLSVALSLVSQPVGVTDHPVLWSPDFPLASEEASGRLINSPVDIIGQAASYVVRCRKTAGAAGFHEQFESGRLRPNDSLACFVASKVRGRINFKSVNYASGFYQCHRYLL